MKFLKKLKIELPHNPAIPLLGLYPDKTKGQKIYICTLMFTAALSAISNTWDQSKCQINRRVNKEAVVHIYNIILLSPKKNEIMPFAVTWMDLEIIILSVVSQTEKGKYHMISFIYEI